MNGSDGYSRDFTINNYYLWNHYENNDKLSDYEIEKNREKQINEFKSRYKVYISLIH